VPGESRMLVAESWPHWWWMAAVERERDQESILRSGDIEVGDRRCPR